MVNILAILYTFPLLALAIPTSSEHPDVLHPDTHTVALDEASKRMIAFDHTGRQLGIYSANADLPHRRGAQCFPMQNGEINSIPGINHLRDVANSKWGKGKRNEVANDGDFPDRAMNVCVDDAGAVVVYSGKPSCKETENVAEGELEGGKVWLQNKQGTSMSSTNTVTHTSKFGVGIKVASTVKFPEIAEVAFEYSTTAEFSNEQGSSNTVSQDLSTMQRIQQPVDEGHLCTITLTTTTCSITGQGSLKMIASGFLWFQYEDKTPPVGGGDKHYKWGMVIQRELPNESDRATVIKFKTSGDITSNSGFHTNGCTEGISIADNNDPEPGSMDDI